jgi:hypothetical protein
MQNPKIRMLSWQWCYSLICRKLKNSYWRSWISFACFLASPAFTVLWPGERVILWSQLQFPQSKLIIENWYWVTFLWQADQLCSFSPFMCWVISLQNAKQQSDHKPEGKFPLLCTNNSFPGFMTCTPLCIRERFNEQTWAYIRFKCDNGILTQLLCFWKISNVLYLFTTHNYSETGFLSSE